jgi:L-2-hydroxyglutarate oxidase LhgO
MSNFKCEAVVIGAGAGGLAVARALATSGIETLIIEKEKIIGSGTSSRNSEVIHAGIYYPHNSLKARLCVEGKAMLYDYCRRRHVRHKNCGKLIVATNEAQKEKLGDIAARAKANGVADMRALSRDEIHALEPEVTAIAGLFSASTGIIDSHHYMETLLGDVQNAGGGIVFQSPVEKGEITGGKIMLQIGGMEPCQVEARFVVNSAGLYATQFMQSLSGFPAAHVPRQFYAKGNYFTLSGKSPFRHLVYPVPEQAGLGVHATLDMAGQCRFGPDVEWVESPEDYRVDPARRGGFYQAIKSYWPGVREEALEAGYSGIRPKMNPRGFESADFILQDEKTHGIKGLVNLMGIESPGLTASPAIAEQVKRLLLA